MRLNMFKKYKVMCEVRRFYRIKIAFFGPVYRNE